MPAIGYNLKGQRFEGTRENVMKSIRLKVKDDIGLKV
jgi:hypothetical protein